MKTVFYALVFLFLAATASAQLSLQYVQPHTIDTAYAAVQDSNLVAINTSAAPQNKLLVFLDGSGSSTKYYTYFPSLAANMGYHAVSVAYPNSPTVGSLCSASSDSLCYDKVRQEICYGTDASTLVSVDTFNSIYTRLAKLLQYLAATYPSQNWDQYLSGGSPVWSKIIVSGHSQGSGHACYFAKTQSCYRLIMFAGVDDYSAYFSRPPHWIRSSSVTPVSNYFSFLHLQDDVVPYAEEYTAMQQLGMTAGDDSTIVDNKTIPFQHSHCLYTNATPNHPAITSAYHDAPVVDYFTPVSGSGYLYDSVWYYMLSTPAVSAIAPVNMPEGLTIFPNPAHEKVFITSAATVITIFSSSGNTVKQLQVQAASLQPVPVDISALAPGIYILQAGTQRTLFTKL